MPVTSTYSIFFGGWYQRTTLHLTEIYDFFKNGSTHSPLSPEKLTALYHNLNLTSVTREAAYLEYVLAKTSENIIIRYYEDGLYVLEIESSDIITAQNTLTHYYRDKLEPAISYIFSLGAPLPKILANIQVLHPLVISHKTKSNTIWRPDESIFGSIYSHLSVQGITVYKTPQYIFINYPSSSPVPVTDLMEMQIFFREFKDQLAKYLEIHRRIWEEVEEIKERKNLTGQEIVPLRLKLDSYQKTLNLIDSRINQMGSYIHTRAAIAKELQVESHLKSLFQYKFEALTDTLSYIKEIWNMTTRYLVSGISVLKDLETQATTNSIRSLQIITSIGVVTSVLTYLTKTDYPRLTATGVSYFFILAFITLVLNYLVSLYYKKQHYPLKFIDHTKSI